MANPKILVVDDEEIVRNLLTDTLKDEGCEVTTTDSAQAAIEKAKETFFDIIFLDIKMPGMDGFEAYKTITRINPEAHMVIITGYATPETTDQVNKLGACDYITKPIDVEEICRLVKTLINANKRRR